MYSEKIIPNALENVQGGITVNRRFVNNKRVADDTVTLANSLERLQNVVNVIATEEDVFSHI